MSADPQQNQANQARLEGVSSEVKQPTKGGVVSTVAGVFLSALGGWFPPHATQ